MWFINGLWHSAYVGDSWIMDLSSRFESALRLNIFLIVFFYFKIFLSCTFLTIFFK